MSEESREIMIKQVEHAAAASLNKKRKKSLASSSLNKTNNSIDLMSKSSCEFVDNISLDGNISDDQPFKTAITATARRKHSSMYELNELIKSDQLVPSDYTIQQNDKQLKGVNFAEISFYKQICSVTDWFDQLSDENKNNLLGMLLTRCGPSQTHTLSLRLSKLHFECPENCCDFVARLPRIISTQIFAFLDPVSLARACQVNRQWNQIGEYDQLWKRLCHLPKWRFSPSAEEKQLRKYSSSNSDDETTNNSVKWKSIFSERYRVKRNWTTGKAFIKTFYGHEGAVSCVQFDDTRIVAGSAMGEIKVWNLDESNQSSSTTTSQSSLTPYLNLVGHSKMIRCLQLDGKLNRLYSGSADNTIKVWDLSEVYPTWSRVTCKMTFLGHTDKVRCLQVNGDILISGSYDHNLKIWDIKTGQCKNTLKGHTDSVLCLQFDHEKIISGSADQTIRIWDFEGNCLKQLTGHKGSITCLHFDSQRIISGSLDFDIRFWNISDGQCIETLDWISKEGHKGAIRCLKADSQKIVSCSDDKTIKIWDIETMERLVTLKSHLDGVTCLQFNDFFILSGSFDTTLKLWDFSYY